MGRIGTSIFFASLFVVGCGSVKDSGSTVDAAGDAGPDADESGDVTVLAKAALANQTPGSNIADVDIISTLPNGDVFATAKTGGDGSATIKVVPGGSVTAAYKRTTDMGYEFITFMAVKPGDTLEFGNRNPNNISPSTSIGSFTYSWPAAPGSPNIYRAHTSCTTAQATHPTLSAAADERTDCHKEPMDVLFTAHTVGTNVLQNFAFRSNVAFTAGGSTSIGGWNTAVAATANITGIPTEVIGANTVNTRFAAVLDGNSERSILGAGNASGAASGGAFTGNFQWGSLGERTLATLTMSRPGNFAQMRVIDFLPANATSWTVASPMLPPWLEGSFLQSSVNRSVEWSLVPGSTGMTHDTVLLHTQWSVTIGGMPHQSQWHFIAPPDTTRIQYPKLPASFNDILPSSEVFIGIAQLKPIEIPTVSNYDAIRAQPSGNIMCIECAVRAGEVQRIITSGF